MNNLLKFLFVFNVLLNDGDCLTELVNTTEEVPQFRIFYGKTAVEKQFPYQVSMRMRLNSGTYYTFCGGSIIARSKVLSAAHCFYTDRKSCCSCTSVKQTQRPLSNMFVVAGSLLNREKLQQDGNSQWRRIRRTVAPENYVFPRRDIAIVFLSKPFIYNDYIDEIPFAREHRIYTGKTCIASGYGQTETKRPSVVLLFAELQVMSTAKCSRMHNNNMRRFVCTSGVLTDVGKGDSGGPLVCKNTGHRNEGTKGILVGVTSGKRESRGRSTKHNSAFFTRVSSYTKFIQNNKAQITVPDFISFMCLWSSFICNLF